MIYAILATIILGCLSVLATLPLLKANNRVFILALALSAGTLLANTFIHIFPEVSNTPGWEFFALLGIGVFFGVERLLHTHHQHVPKNKPQGTIISANLIGDAIHNFVDGLAIAAAFTVSIPLGVTTSLAVLLHEIPQEVADFAVLVNAGLSKKRALVLNLVCSLTALLGVITYHFLGNLATLTPYLLAFSGGAFLYLGLTSLQSIIHPQSKKLGLWQVVLFVLGIAIMVGLKLAE